MTLIALSNNTLDKYCLEINYSYMKKLVHGAAKILVIPRITLMTLRKSNNSYYNYL